jgi:hypothetical protein
MTIFTAEDARPSDESFPSAPAVQDTPAPEMCYSKVLHWAEMEEILKAGLKALGMRVPAGESKAEVALPYYDPARPHKLDFVLSVKFPPVGLGEFRPPTFTPVRKTSGGLK